jgi:hypothetical protein
MIDHRNLLFVAVTLKTNFTFKKYPKKIPKENAKV